MASLICWRRCAKAASIIDMIYSTAVLLTIVGLTAVEISDKRRLDKSEQIARENTTDSTPAKDEEPKSPYLWKLLVGALTIFAFTFFHLWSSVRLFRCSNLLQAPAKERRIAILWVILKIALEIVEFTIQIAIFHAYAFAAIGLVVRLLLVLVVIKFCKEIKILINAE